LAQAHFRGGGSLLFDLAERADSAGRGMRDQARKLLRTCHRNAMIHSFDSRPAFFWKALQKRLMATR
jgi:hypothetical protein